jgi:hypothetical protein
MTQLPVQPAWRLADRPEQPSWLVDRLWSEQAVGIIGGEPKCGNPSSLSISPSPPASPVCAASR